MILAVTYEMNENCEGASFLPTTSPKFPDAMNKFDDVDGDKIETAVFMLKSSSVW